MKRLALCALGLPLAGCNTNAMGFNLLSDPGFPWSVLIWGIVIGVVLFAACLYAWIALRA